MAIIKAPRPSEQYVEHTCVECNKPVMVQLKYIKTKWGKKDWRHKDCYIKTRKFRHSGW